MATATWVAPQWVHSFYSWFPLVTLDQEDRLTSVDLSKLSLWVAPGDSPEWPWASSDPECLRTQLLLLLRNAPVTFRDWSNSHAAPGGALPTLHVPSERLLLSSDKIRDWVDKKYPLDELNGMRDQKAFDTAVALAQLVVGRIRPMCVNAPSHDDIPNPPPLASGLATPLPASLTGDERNLDATLLRAQEQEAWDAIEVICRTEWALDAWQPSPLDALIAAYIFTQRQRLSHRPKLVAYALRVMDRAQQSI